MKQSTEYDCQPFAFHGAPSGLGAAAGGASRIGRRDSDRAEGGDYPRRFERATG
jgi:hypothetical protein